MSDRVPFSERRRGVYPRADSIFPGEVGSAMTEVAAADESFMTKVLA